MSLRVIIRGKGCFLEKLAASGHHQRHSHPETISGILFYQLDTYQNRKVEIRINCNEKYKLHYAPMG